MGLEPTREQTIKFINYMLRKHGLKTVDKKKSWIMKVIAWFLGTFGIMNSEDFMKYYSVNIFNRVYIPWRVGEAEDLRLSSQMSTIIHECQHAVQQKMEGFLYNIFYLFSSKSRSFYETEAYRTNMEIHYWYTNKIISPLILSELLKNYGCSLQDVEASRRSLEAASSLVAQGTVITEATKNALSWINRNMSGLKGKGVLLPDKYYKE